MERSDGLQFTVDWNQLSTSDQAVLHQMSKAPAVAKPKREPSPNALPDVFELKDVPMVVQKNNYCVPASASMIAGFHGLATDQDEVAELSSAMSTSHLGTYPADMLLAMEKLGFHGQSLHWHNTAEFFQNVLPRIRADLVNHGPVYISFKPGVFGDMGHGCVIVGYNDRREEMSFHNPWGHAFDKDYDEVANDGYGVVLIKAPETAPVASDVFVKKIQSALPQFNGDFLQLCSQLDRKQIAYDLVWCSRRDAREDRRFAKDTARDHGRKILELAFERNPAVLIPSSPDGKTEAYFFVTRPLEGGARFLVQSIDAHGWSPPELQTLGSLTRNWATSFALPDQKQKIWELPMIELHPLPSM